MEGIAYLENFITRPAVLFDHLKEHAAWDKRMQARWTASYGVAYNYSQITYPFLEMLPTLQDISLQIGEALGFTPNNCLINYYLDGHSKMGFHSDQTEMLATGTGIVIISVGETRTLRFRNITDKTLVNDYPLPAGSLIAMSQEVQVHWQHSIPTSDTQEGRMSLTFRHIVA